MRTRAGCRFTTEQRDDEIVRPYMEKLMVGQNFSQDQTHDGESNELRIIGTEEQQNNESVGMEEDRGRLKLMWKSG
ncbi:hypothetical protein HAX54_044757, partial [Datura stramonium]|nr:hypothetical protein [Datura stramonium]